MTTALRNNARSDCVPGTVLDLQQLLDRCMGSLELAERCLVRFEQKLRADLEQVQWAADAQDYPEVVQIAHRVKGSAATVAAAGLAQAAAALEDDARGDGSVDLTDALADFLSEVERFLENVPRFSPGSEIAD